MPGPIDTINVDEKKDEISQKEIVDAIDKFLDKDRKALMRSLEKDESKPLKETLKNSCGSIEDCIYDKINT